ncbi:helix-turn-helix domain-containing protein [Bradyrhizobium sp.]|uniref:AraC-like ligand-binding domain-containing protein n=1 Tax=Bradyrhizobium sp. TaxID=376 RepID=UPI001D2A2B86|nr:helix-turn-helix domain-containing protein [Bradyrhizobium sp.]MBI5318563.1 helix-turn-helix domain-containing protein [Bradyrhizobium sp.]
MQNNLAVVSTADAAPGERLGMWGDFVGRHIGPLRADTFGDPQFAGRLELGDSSGVSVARIVVSRHRVQRTPGLIRRDSRDYVKLVAQIEGAACFEQNGRKVVLAPGEWSLYDMTRPYTVSNSEPINQVIMLLPRDELVRLGLDLDDLVVRRFAGRAGVGRLTYGLLVSAFESLRGDTPAPAGGDLAQTIASHIELAVLDRGGTSSDVSVRELTRDRVKRYIDVNLDDPLLSLDRIAAAIGCSKRYLHKLFDGEAETLNAHIWRARLERIRQDLADPSQDGRSITEIAFSRGFSSSTHFSRSFRESCGTSPRAYRLLTQGTGPLRRRDAHRQWAGQTRRLGVAE